MTLNLAYDAKLDVDEWRTRYSLGLVPDELPYGLNRIARPDEYVAVTPAPGGERLRQAGRLVRRQLKVSRGLTRGTEAYIAWDEYSALRVPINAGGPRLAGVIWLTDRMNGQHRSARDLLLLRALAEFDVLWCLSRAQIPVLSKPLTPRKTRVEFLRFGIDHQFFTPARRTPKEPAILCIGRDRDRDYATLIAALREIQRREPGVRLLAQLPPNVASPPGVVRLPKLSHHELRHLYREASMLMVATKPNLHVSGMTAALEAMATGRPVVMSDTAGMGDYVRKGETGLLASSGDASALAEAALTLIGNVELQAEMGGRAREVVEGAHTTAGMAVRLRQLVDEVRR